MKNQSVAPTRRKIGRPLSFKREAVLQKAMLAFWRSGYETTSVADLTKAMGITPPSLYAAFGDKEALFLEAVSLYAGSDEHRLRVIREAASAYAAASTMLMACATLYTGKATPPGCLLASSTASGSERSADVRAAVASFRTQGRQALRGRIKQDINLGILPENTDATSLSDLVFAIMQGMSALARDGASRAELEGIVSQAMAAWPQTAFKKRRAARHHLAGSS
jgi:AcrR family transcriptional regulator